MSEVLKQVNIKEFIDKYTFIKGSKVAVALSGGPDSVCLLHLFLKIKDEYNISLSAIHLNHGIRQEEADKDMQFCINLCKQFNVPIVCKTVEVLKMAQSGESVELAARRIRYEFFETIDCDYIATAHNSDDNAETVILNMLRGSGTKGACGIPVIRDKYIRPILNFSKAEILDYLQKNNLSFVIDSSNAKNDYSRNKIRNLVFPIFKEINPNFLENINRFSNNIKLDQEYLQTKAQDLFLKNYNNEVLDFSNVFNKDDSLLYRLVKIYFEKFNLQFNKMVADLVINAIKQNQNLKHNISKNKYVLLQKRKLSILVEDQNVKFLLKTQNVNNLFLNSTIDCDKIVGKLVISKKIAGDKIKLKNRRTKELRKIYNEMKIPQHLRDILPVARDDLGVIYAYKVGIAQRVLPTKESKNLLKIWVEESYE